MILCPLQQLMLFITSLRLYTKDRANECMHELMKDWLTHINEWDEHDKPDLGSPPSYHTRHRSCHCKLHTISSSLLTTLQMNLLETTKVHTLHKCTESQCWLPDDVLTHRYKFEEWSQLQGVTQNQMQDWISKGKPNPPCVFRLNCEIQDSQNRSDLRKNLMIGPLYSQTESNSSVNVSTLHTWLPILLYSRKCELMIRSSSEISKLNANVYYSQKFNSNFNLEATPSSSDSDQMRDKDVFRRWSASNLELELRAWQLTFLRPNSQVLPFAFNIRIWWHWVDVRSELQLALCPRLLSWWKPWGWTL